MDQIPVSVLFAYGASDRGPDHAVGLKRLLSAEGIEATVDIANWGVAAAAGENYDATWIAHKRFSKLATDARSLWAIGFDAGLTTLVQAQSPLKRVVIAMLRRTIRDAYVNGYESVSAGTLPVASDVLGYLRNPTPVLAAIDEDIAGFIATRPSPRVLVGLSLGGIIYVDALSRMVAAGSRPDITLLTTVGSQAPYLFACNALGSLHRKQAKLPLFLPWLNVWSPNDFLSFPARPIFSAYLRDATEKSDPNVIRDHEADNPSLFPAAHSQYFQDHMTTATEIGRILMDLGQIEKPSPPSSRHLK